MRIIPVFSEINHTNLQTVSGLDFEDLCLKAYRYKYPENYVQKTSINDFGADILINLDNDRKMVLQCKTSEKGSKSIGLKAIQEIVASKEKYVAEFACVLTNSTFTQAARELAEANLVTLIDINDFIQLFSKTVLELGDTKLIYDKAVHAFSQQEYTYFIKYLDRPELVYEISDLEMMYLVKMVLHDVVKTGTIDADSSLLKGLPYIMHLALQTSNSATRR